VTSGIDEDRDLDRRLAGWMRNGPNAAPREVVDRALIETTTIVQLPKGGGSHAIRSIVIGTLLALIVLFLAVGLVVVLLR
jgi:hypothetical protein